MRSTVQYFSGRKLSGPASTVKPSISSVRSLPPDGGCALEDGEFYAFFFERYCAGEGGDSAADDGNPHYCPCASRSRRTALQAAMKGGYVLRDGTRENASPSDAA